MDETSERATRSQHERTMTDKGLTYQKELKVTARSRQIKAMDVISSKLSDALNNGSERETIKDLYKEWLTVYESLLQAHYAYQDLLESTDKTEDENWFQSKNSLFLKIKKSVEQWFNENASVQGSSHKAEDTRSRRSVYSSVSKASRASSQLSAAKLKEEQRKAELHARVSKLGEKKKIEEEKLKLKIKEEELELQTELEISDAKSKVIDELERSLLRDQMLEDDLELDNNGFTVKEESPVSNSLWTRSALNPNISAFVPRKDRSVHSTALFDNQNSFNCNSNLPGHSVQIQQPLPSRSIQIQQPPPSHLYSSALNSENGFSVMSKELNKPKAEIQKFSGNPMEYHRFLRQFNARVCTNTDSFEERLNFLFQFTVGEANKIVSGYSHLDAERGYKAALDEFKERYGDPEVVAQSYVKKALDWPVIKDSAKALDEFAIFLRECQFAVENIEAARVLEYSENLKVLVKKLPYYLHERWRNVVYEIKDKKQVVQFGNLVAFVRKEAKKAIDPVYGKEVLGGKVSLGYNKQSQGNKLGHVLHERNSAQRKNFATITEENTGSKPSIAFDKPCLNCKGPHSLNLCSRISEKQLSDRYAFLKSKGLCFGCLRSGHLKGSCRNKLKCNKCGKFHPSILHANIVNNETGVKTVNSNEVQLEHSNRPTSEATSSATHMGAGSQVQQALPIVPVRLKSKLNDDYIETYAFLDSGSTATFCSEHVMRALNLDGKRTKIGLHTMGQDKVQSTYVIKGLEICSLDGENIVDLPPVFTQINLPVSTKDLISAEDIEKWSYLREVPIQRINSEVNLLIGINVPKVMEPWEVIPSVNGGPFAVKTLLGWVINGPLGIISPDEALDSNVHVNRISAQIVPTLDEQIRNQFNHDFNERIIEDKTEPSLDDIKFMELVSKSAKIENGHYTINLPFKSENVNMPNNRKQAEQRLTSLTKRLVRNNEFRLDYIKFINKMLNEGHARLVASEELQEGNGKIWYLPHHGVYHPQKGKLRVVFDCAARYQGTSLNDQLLQGPNLTNTLIGTLLRFRQEEVAIMGDIDSMFHQVRVPTQDANFLRFLWFQDGDCNKSIVEYQMVVHLFGATSSPSCANFALRRTAEDCKERFSSAVIDTVFNNFYVDDCLKSVDTADNAIELVKDLQEVLRESGFTIRKWISNSRDVMNSVPITDRATEVKDLDLDQDVLPLERALGVQWCVESDTFRFKIVIKEQPLTRRGILSMVSSVYDPLGFLAPFMLTSKRILQELCKLQLGWDDNIPEPYVNRWQQWFSDIQKLTNFKIDRCIKPKGFGEVVTSQLHHFSDASEIGYGTVSYLRLQNAEGNVHSSFVIGKSRVAPLKQTTIPRLELTAATVAVRTNRMLKDELDIKIDSTFFWTDSMAVLRYIRNTSSRFHTFVANRLAVIHDGSNSNEWQYINTKLNPADCASRGISANDLHEHKWVEPPEFLSKPEVEWPRIPSDVSIDISGQDPEVKRVVVSTMVACESTLDSKGFGLDRLIRYYSSWFKLKRGVAWILKIRKELLRRAQNKGTKDKDFKQTNLNMSGSTMHQQSFITVEDVNEAEYFILRFVQKEHFSSEIESLSSAQPHIKRNSKLRKLDPIMNEGLVRVGGRLDKSSMPLDSKHPIILPKESHVSDLLLRQIHCDLKHSGRNYMLSRLREQYWIIHAPSAIRKVISECITCRRQRSKVCEQKMANLPEDRLTPDEPPFTRVGVDYFGPFEVKQRRSLVKRYGVIFTCLSCRAVHIEVAASLDTDSYINALRRFIARRGQVIKMRSDNGTNFVGAHRELANAIADWNVSQIQRSMVQRNIDWQFNPPAGSHHGGVWERIIRIIRNAMFSVLKEQTLDDEGLQTLMCEIESILNDRPITRNSDQHCDLEALTPNHLLLMNRKPNLPPGVFCKTDNYVRRRWKQIQYMADLFWKRWTHEYLPLLQERQKWHEKRRNLEIGDIVLIVDSNAPRNSWPLGKILETIADKTGYVRQVKVKTSTSVLIRPVTKLCLLLEME